MKQGRGSAVYDNTVAGVPARTLPARCAAPREILRIRLISAHVRPCTRNRVTSAASTGTRGRPSRVPPLRARFRPMTTRYRINERSNSSTAPMTVNTILPIGVEVSIDSESETKSMPKA